MMCVCVCIECDSGAGRGGGGRRRFLHLGETGAGPAVGQQGAALAGCGLGLGAESVRDQQATHHQGGDAGETGGVHGVLVQGE